MTATSTITRKAPPRFRSSALRRWQMITPEQIEALTGTAQIEAMAEQTRTVRAAMLHNKSDDVILIDQIAKVLVPKLKPNMGDDDASIEWGRALIAISSHLGGLLVHMRELNAQSGRSATVDAGLFINALTFVGLDLLDGK